MNEQILDECVAAVIVRPMGRQTKFQWDQGSYGYKLGDRVFGCLATMIVLRHAPDEVVWHETVMGMGRYALESVDLQNDSVLRVASRALGINYLDAYVLFSSENDTPEKLRNAAESVKRGYIGEPAF